MESLSMKKSLDRHYEQLTALSDDLEPIIDDLACVAFNEFKNYIEGLTCCERIHHGILDREARFEYAMANLKAVVWEKFRRNMKSEMKNEGVHISTTSR